MTRSTTAGRTRHLGRQHFAFMRGLLEGVAVEKLWDRYMTVEGQRSDPRLVPATLAWIRAELAAAALREHRPGTARLLRLDAQRLVVLDAKLPTLEQFAEEAGLEDETQADQLAAYEERYGRASARQRHRSLLLQRQLEALRWLEQLIARDPAAGDAIASWLRPELAEFLAQAGLFTLSQLAEHINGIGRAWWRSIGGIGPIKARQIDGWVTQHQASIGVTIGQHVEHARSDLHPGQLGQVMKPATDIRPLEKFIVPSELDGRGGRYRRPQADCLLKADNDHDAILAWLRSKRGPSVTQDASESAASLALPEPLRWLASLSNTQRSYRKEAERFLLWAILQRRTAMSSMRAEDCTAYAEFLVDPRPRSRWCGPRARERWSPLWRPFEGPLSIAAQRQAITILKNLYGFLADQNYLSGNPWTAVPVPRGGRSGLDASRSLTQAQWTLVSAKAAAAGEHSSAIRLRLALYLLYATGLRASEAVNARISDLQAVDYYDADAGQHVKGWALSVLGKGQRRREVPVPDELVADIRSYLAHRGLAESMADERTQDVYILSPATDVGERAPALASGHAHKATDGISESTLYRQLKAHFERCAADLRAQGDELQSRRLQRASTHWLRHTHASHALASGVKIEEAQQNLGHVSLATTTAYVTTEQARRMRSMNAFWTQAGRAKTQPD